MKQGNIIERVGPSTATPSSTYYDSTLQQFIPDPSKATFYTKEEAIERLNKLKLDPNYVYSLKPAAKAE